MRHRAVLVAATALAVSAGSATAYAYFTASGSGGAAASTGALQTVTVAATAGTPSGELVPGGNADVSLRVTNPNGFAVTLVSVTGSGAITASNSCSPTGVTFTDQTGLSISIPSGTSQVHLSGAAAMSPASADACQGATFTIPVTIVVHK